MFDFPNQISSPLNKLLRMCQLYEDAKSFYELYYHENELKGLEDRLAEVRVEISDTGSYWQSEEELIFGTKVAWRNTNRCIG